ncbi:MAG: radical SAM protein [Candidatus Omnitrophica bacterium]|nr:radical SAM protein [Candidatus Omnitrophota bacterium]
MKKYYVIPFFIPFRGCPNKCVFCDQNRITGEKMPAPGEISEKMEKYLHTMPISGVHIEAGFFGGSFTGLSRRMQTEYLSPLGPYLKKDRIHGIRLSTRPDMVDEETVVFLKDKGVTCVELGVQSMCEGVLSLSRRGHTPLDTERASRLVLRHGLMLGHQMMVGLPGSSREKELYTAERIKQLGASQVRIYPLLVIKGTELEKMWKSGEYTALGLEEAAERAALLISFFESSGVKVIRCGLHPSPGLISGEEYLAGPFHPSFGQMARRRAKELVCRDADRSR